MLKTVPLEWFAGKTFILSGASTDITPFIERYGPEFRDAGGISLVLDGETYTALEDPSDGYRSSLDRVFMDDTPVSNHFQPIPVEARYLAVDGSRACDIVEFATLGTGMVVASVGTENIDDYYPGFVGRFDPKLLTAAVETLDEFTAADVVDPNLKDPQWGSW